MVGRQSHDNNHNNTKLIKIYIIYKYTNALWQNYFKLLFKWSYGRSDTGFKLTIY